MLSIPSSPAPNADAITQLIRDGQSVEEAALDRLRPLVYADLRAMAARQLAEHHGHATLQPTALVHDVLVRLLEATPHGIANGIHLFNVAGRMTRQILVDRARRAHAEKRGGEWRREDLFVAMQLQIPETTDLALLDEAICGLEQVDERLARIVELRYVVGLSVPAAAKVLGIDERTVYRD